MSNHDFKIFTQLFSVPRRLRGEYGYKTGTKVPMQSHAPPASRGASSHSTLQSMPQSIYSPKLTKIKLVNPERSSYPAYKRTDKRQSQQNFR